MSQRAGTQGSQKKADRAAIERVGDGLLSSLRDELGLPHDIARRARRESPLLVKDLYDRPSYWLVPIALGDRLLGFLRLSLEGATLAYGRFGQGRELGDFPPLSYLSQEAAAREIGTAFSESCEQIGLPQFVHDGPVDRIAWLSRGRSADGRQMLLFWSFGFTYSRPERGNREYGLA